jgi:5-methylcytosine-specific restriction endonuclease McrA
VKRTRIAQRSVRPHKALESELDTLWASLVRKRDHRRCRVCLNNYVVQAHHIFKRRYTGTRWVLDNGVTLCLMHHDKIESDRDYAEVQAKLWLGVERYAELQRLSNDITFRTVEFMERARLGLQLHAQALEAEL